MAWNEAGTLLASGSDDRRVLLWSYPADHGLRPPLRVETQHTGNIFGVRILPYSNSVVVTGAMDYEVQLHRLDAPPSPAAASPRAAAAAASPASSSGGSPAAGAASTVEVPVQTTEFKCHRGRVKVIIFKHDATL